MHNFLPWIFAITVPGRDADDLFYYLVERCTALQPRCSGAQRQHQALHARKHNAEQLLSPLQCQLSFGDDE